jgi:exodeoxyribonuclease VII small subunit
MSANKNYNEMQNELNQIIDDLQSGNIDVDNAMTKYDRGQLLIKDIGDYLKKAENKITNIKNK